MPTSRKRKKAKFTPKPVNKAVDDSQKEAKLHNEILQAYQKKMLEITRRTTTIHNLIATTNTTGYRATDFETIGLNFRKIAECIIYANLVGHKAEYDALYPPQKHDWQIKLLIERIKGINPGYYPNPGKREYTNPVNGVFNVANIPDGEWMTEDELIEMYNKCGKLLHAEKASDPESDVNEYLPLFIQWGEKLHKLLNHHIVMLPDGKHSIWCQMSEIGHVGPHAYIFVQLTPEEIKERGLKRNNPVS